MPRFVGTLPVQGLYGNMHGLRWVRLRPVPVHCENAAVEHLSKFRGDFGAPTQEMTQTCDRLSKKLKHLMSLRQIMNLRRRLRQNRAMESGKVLQKIGPELQQKHKSGASLPGLSEEYDLPPNTISRFLLEKTKRMTRKQASAKLKSVLKTIMKDDDIISVLNGCLEGTDDSWASLSPVKLRALLIEASPGPGAAVSVKRIKGVRAAVLGISTDKDAGGTPLDVDTIISVLNGCLEGTDDSWDSLSPSQLRALLIEASPGADVSVSQIKGIRLAVMYDGGDKITESIEDDERTPLDDDTIISILTEFMEGTDDNWASLSPVKLRTLLLFKASPGTAPVNVKRMQGIRAAVLGISVDKDADDTITGSNEDDEPSILLDVDTIISILNGCLEGTDDSWASLSPVKLRALLIEASPGAAVSVKRIKGVRAAVLDIPTDKDAGGTPLDVKTIISVLDGCLEGTDDSWASLSPSQLRALLIEASPGAAVSAKRMKGIRAAVLGASGDAGDNPLDDDTIISILNDFMEGTDNSWASLSPVKLRALLFTASPGAGVGTGRIKRIKTAVLAASEGGGDVASEVSINDKELMTSLNTDQTAPADTSKVRGAGSYFETMMQEQMRSLGFPFRSEEEIKGARKVLNSTAFPSLKVLREAQASLTDAPYAFCVEPGVSAARVLRVVQHRDQGLPNESWILEDGSCVGYASLDHYVIGSLDQYTSLQASLNYLKGGGAQRIVLNLTAGERLLEHFTGEAFKLTVNPAKTEKRETKKQRRQNTEKQRQNTLRIQRQNTSGNCQRPNIRFRGTPDILFDAPVLIDAGDVGPGFNTRKKIECNWIEVKSFYGTTLDHNMKEVKAQVGKYCVQFGPGALVFAQGFCDTLEDEFASDQVMLLNNPRNARRAVLDRKPQPGLMFYPWLRTWISEKKGTPHLGKVVLLNAREKAARKSLARRAFSRKSNADRVHPPGSLFYPWVPQQGWCLAVAMA